MAKFHFKLTPVLKLRIRQEKSCLLTVYNLERTRVQLEKSIRECKKQLDEELGDLRSQLIGKANIHTARFQAFTIANLIHRTDELVCKLTAVHVDLKIERTKLAAASSRRCAVQLLFDRKLHEWKIMCLAKEQMELDELTSVRSQGLFRSLMERNK
jgi:flagellar export protein FliJ